MSDRGLGGNEKLVLESKELRSEDKLEGKDTLIEWNLYAFSGIAEENQTEMLVSFSSAFLKLSIFTLDSFQHFFFLVRNWFL